MSSMESKRRVVLPPLSREVTPPSLVLDSPTRTHSDPNSADEREDPDSEILVVGSVIIISIKKSS